MSNIHNRSDPGHPRSHRGNDRDCSPRTKISECSDVDSANSDSTAHGSRHLSQYHGARRVAVDFGRESCGGHRRRGAIDFGRGPHNDFNLSESKDSEDSEGFRHMRRGSAAERDDFRGFLGSRRSERHLARIVRKEGVTEPSVSVRGEDYRRWRDLRARPERLDRRSDRTSRDARGDGEEGDFEPPELRRATALPRDGAPRMDERARYSYYKPHGPRPEDGTGPSRS